MDFFINTILDNLRQNPEKVILREHYKDKTHNITCGRLYHKIMCACHVFFRLGVTTNDRIIFIASNSIAYIALDLAIYAYGAINVPLNNRLTVKEISYMVRDSTPALIIIDDDDLKKQLEQELSGGIKIMLLDEMFAGEQAGYSRRQPDFSRPVMIVYTSGTSGQPKGVILTGNNLKFIFPILMEMFDDYRTYHKMKSYENIVFHYLPLCFLPSRLAVYTMLCSGIPVSLCMSLPDFKSIFVAVNPHCFLTVPLILNRIKTGVEGLMAANRLLSRLYQTGLQAFRQVQQSQRTLINILLYKIISLLLFSGIRKRIGSRIRFILSGSAPLSEDTQQWFRMIGINVYQAYGLTETSGVATRDNPYRELNAGYVGYTVRDTEIRLTTEQELICKGPHIFPGYWNNPAETAKSLKEGWLYTGDTAEQSDGGNWKIIGRKKNLLVLNSGHNVAPEPVEQKITDTIPGVKQVVLIGDARPYLILILTGKIDPAVLEKKLETYNRDLPHYMKIRGYYIFPGELNPENNLMTANLKLKRREIVKYFAREINQIYKT